MSGMKELARNNLATQIENNIKIKLITGSLKPDERLVTKSVADQLGVSVTPVREALLRLVSSGALVAVPSQAFMVPRISLADFQEITVIRKNLEIIAVMEATHSIRPHELTILHQLYSRFQDAKAEGNVGMALLSNYEFRFQLYEYAKMPILVALIEQLWVRVGPSFNYLYPQSSDIQGHHNYDNLLDALAQLDSERSVEIILKSIDDGAAILTKRLWGG